MQATITQSFIQFGGLQGVPCVYVSYEESDVAMTNNEIMSAIMEYRGKVEYVVIDTVLKNNADAIQLVRIITETGMKVLLKSNTTDDVNYFAYNKRVNFSLKFVQPDSKENNLNHSSLNALREGDEIYVETDDKAVLEFAMKVLKDKMFTRPELTFIIPEELVSTVMKLKYTCRVRVISKK